MTTLAFILEVGILGIAATIGCMAVGLGFATLFDTINERRK